MSKRKLVCEAVSGSNDCNVKTDDTFLNHLFGAANELNGKLELGETLLDITKGLKHVTQKKKKNDADAKFYKYTILLYITRGVINSAAQFLEIESKFSQKEIINILFKHLKYELPDGSRLNRRKEGKYFGRDHDLYWLEISEDHAYIYVGDSDGRCYTNNLKDVMDFIYRKDPENRPRLCSIM